MSDTTLPTYPRDAAGAVIPMTDTEIGRYFGIGDPAPRTVAGTLGADVYNDMDALFGGVEPKPPRAESPRFSTFGR